MNSPIKPGAQKQRQPPTMSLQMLEAPHGCDRQAATSASHNSPAKPDEKYSNRRLKKFITFSLRKQTSDRPI